MSFFTSNSYIQTSELDFEELTQEDFDKSVRENTKLCELVNYHLHKRNTVIKTVMEFGELREEVL